jgi:hypothetical protein
MEKRSLLKWRYLAAILGLFLVENLFTVSALASLVSIDDLFFPTLTLGDELTIDPAYKDQNKTYSPCIKIDYPEAKPSDGYSTLIWRYPKDNLGKLKGRNLDGAIRLTFWARSDKTMDEVKFSVGAFKNDSEVIPKIVTLNKTWIKFEIPLIGMNLTDIRAGFACKLTENGAIYLNGISYEI